MTQRPQHPFVLHNVSWSEFEQLFRDVGEAIVGVANDSFLDIKYRHLEQCTTALCGRKEDNIEGWFGPGNMTALHVFHHLAMRANVQCKITGTLWMTPAVKKWCFGQTL